MEFGLPRDPSASSLFLADSYEKRALSMAELRAARSRVNTSPSEAQVEAGNYAKGKVLWKSFPLAIENPKGSIRSGTDKSGKAWSVRMKHDYGYFKGITGKDKDHLDVFIGPELESELVHVINQVDPSSGKLDEHKVIVGAHSEEQACEIYLSNYEQGWKGLGSVRAFTLRGFKKWVRKPSNLRKEAGEVKYAAVYKFTGNVQGTGLRKTLHSLLDEYGVPGMAYNDARQGHVLATIDADEELRQEILQRLREVQTGKEKVKEWNYEEQPRKERLRPVALDEAAIRKMHKRQGFTENLNQPINVAQDWTAERYRLKPDEAGRLTGLVSKLAERQLRGLEPIYASQFNGKGDYGPIYWNRKPKTGFEKEPA